MNEKIDIIIRTLEERMESDAILLDGMRELRAELEKSKIVPDGEWEEINEAIDLKRCSTCKASSRPTTYCSSCGSKNL